MKQSATSSFLILLKMGLKAKESGSGFLGKAGGILALLGIGTGVFAAKNLQKLL
jgi:hypothetical protein